MRSSRLWPRRSRIAVTGTTCYRSCGTARATHEGHTDPLPGSAASRTSGVQRCAPLWIPSGFAHGFCVLSEFAEVLYKATDYYAPEYERCILWSDPELDIDWPLPGPPVVSAKDAAGTPLQDAEVFQ